MRKTKKKSLGPPSSFVSKEEHFRNVGANALALCTEVSLSHHSDVVFHCGEEAVYAHKIMFLGKSDVMCDFFQTTSEREYPGAPTQISLPGVSTNTVKKVIEYMYQGETNFESAADKKEFLDVVNTLQLKINIPQGDASTSSTAPQEDVIVKPSQVIQTQPSSSVVTSSQQNQNDSQKNAFVDVLAEFTEELINGMTRAFYDKAKKLANNDTSRVKMLNIMSAPEYNDSVTSAATATLEQSLIGNKGSNSTPEDIPPTVIPQEQRATAVINETDEMVECNTISKSGDSNLNRKKKEDTRKKTGNVETKEVAKESMTSRGKKSDGESEDLPRGTAGKSKRRSATARKEEIDITTVSRTSRRSNQRNQDDQPIEEDPEEQTNAEAAPVTIPDESVDTSAAAPAEEGSNETGGKNKRKRKVSFVEEVKVSEVTSNEVNAEEKVDTPRKRGRPIEDMTVPTVDILEEVNPKGKKRKSVEAEKKDSKEIEEPEEVEETKKEEDVKPRRRT
jgi:hypothetical protein